MSGQTGDRPSPRFERVENPDGTHTMQRHDMGPSFMQMFNVVRPAPDDKDFRKVCLALLNPKYHMRSVKGIATETGLDADMICEAIDRNMSEILSNPTGKFWFLRLRGFHLNIKFLMNVFKIDPDELGMSPDWLDPPPESWEDR